MDAVLNKAKAIVGLVAAVVTALLVSFPDSAELKLAGGILGAVLTALTVYAVPNKEISDGKHAAP